MKTVSRILLATVIFLWCCPTLFAVAGAKHSEPDFMLISDNISNKAINDFVQDCYGYIWIATDRGLNKYNGYDFHCYFNNSNPLSLCDNQVKSLLSDSNGCLWVGTVNGLCHYTKQDNFQRFELSGTSPYVSNIMETPKGNIVIFTSDNLEYYDKSWNDFRFRTAFSFSNNIVNYSFIDSTGRIWIVNQDKMNWYDIDSNTSGEAITLEGFVYLSYMQNGNILWLCSLDGRVRLFDTRTGLFVDTPKEVVGLKGGIRSIFPCNEQSLIFYTNELDAYIYNTSTGSIISSTDSHFPIDLPDAELSTTMLDSQSNLWIGSRDQGFTVRYAYKKQFNSNSYLTGVLAKKSVVGLAADKADNIIIATNHHGIFIWNQAANEVERAVIDGSVKSFRPGRVFVDSRGYIYIGYMFWIGRYSLKGNTLTPNMAYFIPAGQTYDMAEDRYGRIWVGSYSSMLYVLGRDDNSVTPVQAAPQERMTFVPAVIEYDEKHMASIALNRGLTIIDIDDFSTRTLSPLDSIPSGVFIPTALKRDSGGKIWIGTRGQGLLQFDPATEHFTTIDKVLCKEIMDINEDMFGNIWISTMDGLVRYDRTVDRYVAYFASDGTGGDLYNESAGTITSNGTILFGGTHGLTVFNPIDITSRRKMNILFEDVTINNFIQHAYNSDALEQHVTEAKHVTLRQKSDVNVGISFVAIDYNEFPSSHYVYRLDGFEENWIDARGNRKAFYSNLPAGKYTFRVMVWDNYYTQVMAEDSMTLTVEPPFYLTPIMRWCVYPLLGAALLLLVILVGLRIDRQKKEVARAESERENEQRTNDMNMHYFVNISHEIRTPLTMIKGPLDLLVNDSAIGEENRKLLTIVVRNVNRLLRFLNQMMDIGKLNDDTLRLSVGYFDAVSVTNNMLEVFRINAVEKNICLATRGLDDSFVTLLNDDYLEKIVTNLLSNAIKFTPEGGKIDVTFDVVKRDAAAAMFSLTDNDTAEEYMQFSVADTGMGIPPDQLEKIFLRYYQVEQSSGRLNYGTGIGLYYSRRLVELHHGYIKAENRTDTRGSLFTLILPVGEDSYADDLRLTEKSQQYKYPDVAVAEASSEVGTDHPQTVLIVEDDTEVAHLLKTIFATKFKVVNRFDADSALAALEEIEPDIIISDIVMPGKLDGYELCRTIKQNLPSCHIPVILLTAKTTVEAQVDGLKAGADAYVMKPFDASYLVAMVDSQLTNRDRLRSILGTVTHTEKIEGGKLSPYDKMFLDNLYELMEKELSNPELNIARMTDVLHIGRTKFYYKVKGLTGENPNTFFKTYKLNRASQLLSSDNYNISEVADITGFSTLSHFSVSFKKQFGVAPSEYQSQHSKEHNSPTV